jgi:predicted P-loop ATPase
VEVTQYTNLEWLRRNRSQLWAEAVEAFRAGEQWHQTRAMEAEQRKIAEDRFTNEDPYLSVLANWLGRKGDSIFTISDACTKALGNLTVSTNRVSRLLVQCGAAPLNRRQKNGLRIREWVKPGIPLPEGRTYEDPESGSAHVDTLNKIISLDERVRQD